jgi:CRISPR/Cas system CSM-associated protein Csm3 (group 7 of RAMP superfamily)
MHHRNAETSKINLMKYQRHKVYIAHLVIESRSVLCVGAGFTGLDEDMAVRTDHNGLPCIPATGLTGALRALLSTEQQDHFGKEKETPEGVPGETEGSHVILSDAYLLDHRMQVHQNLEHLQNHSFLQRYFLLPKREHVRIDHKGTAIDKGKFDTTFVYKGSRFKFELKYQPNEASPETDAFWEMMLETFASHDFLVGAGVTNGYGRTSVISIQHRIFNLTDTTDFEDYLAYTPNLNKAFRGSTSIQAINATSHHSEKECIAFTTDAMHIGAGYGDLETDAINYTEDVVVWNDHIPEWVRHYVIPGTSVKGVLAHHFAFLSNCAKHRYIDTGTYQDQLLTDLMSQHYTTVREQQQALQYLRDAVATIWKPDTDTHFHKQDVMSVFGCATDIETSEGAMGKLIVEDIYIPADTTHITETLFEHNAIDRFTSGTIDSALYSEKVFAVRTPIPLRLWKAKTLEEEHRTILDEAILQLRSGRLPIGGNTTNGNGFLTTQV